MNTKGYYKSTMHPSNCIDCVIGIDEYQEKLFRDAPRLESLERNPFWNFLKPNNGAASNALYLCSFNDIFKGYGEKFHYCEGVIKEKDGAGKDVGVHHAWLYSTKYRTYVDCTLPPDFVGKYSYFISDIMKGKQLDKFIDSCWTYDEEGEMVGIPKFIHENVALYMKI